MYTSIVLTIYPSIYVSLTRKQRSYKFIGIVTYNIDNYDLYISCTARISVALTYVYIHLYIHSQLTIGKSMERGRGCWHHSPTPSSFFMRNKYFNIILSDSNSYNRNNCISIAALLRLFILHDRYTGKHCSVIHESHLVYTSYFSIMQYIISCKSVMNPGRIYYFISVFLLYLVLNFLTGYSEQLDASGTIIIYSIL